MVQDDGPFFHGTKAQFEPGPPAGTPPAVGDGPGPIYEVEPTGPVEDDSNLTDPRFASKPTRSYRGCATTSPSSTARASRRSTTDL